MSSTMSDLQKIVVSLSAAEVVVEPGNVAQLVVTVTNQQESSDRLSLDVEGLDVEWCPIPVPAFNVAPGAQASERILFKISRNSENRAGSYPFLVRVQAMETGETGVAQATLIVKPFSALQLDLNPKRAVAAFFSPLNDFDVTISNIGNHEETLDLSANDPEDGCAYEYDTDRVTLKPGQAQTVPLAIRPKVTPLIGSPRLYGFAAVARSTDDAYVSVNAHGQIERHALINPLLGIFFVLLASFGLGWVFFRPQPPKPIVINKFEAPNKFNIREGDPLTLVWDAQNFKALYLLSKGKNDTDFVPEQGVNLTTPVGSVTVKPRAPQMTYKLVARGDGNEQQDSKPVVVDVAPAPVAPAPSIKDFYADPPVIHQGESTILSWKASGQEEYVLEPGVTPPPKKYEETHQVMPDKDTLYVLKAIGKDDKMATKSVKVTVVPPDQSVAKVTLFAGPKATIFVGDKVKLRWKTLYSQSVHIDASAGQPVGDVRPVGEAAVQIDVPTVFTLTALDSKGNKTVQTLTLTPKPKPPTALPDEAPTGENSVTPGDRIQLSPPPDGH